MIVVRWIIDNTIKKSKILIRILHLFILFLLIQMFVVGKGFSEQIIDAGTYGQTYQIAEPDAYKEIMDKVKAVNWQSHMERIKNKVSDLGKISLGLPYAKKTTVKRFIPEYKLEMDIKDSSGNILYPKGYKYNPLAYLSLRGAFIFFNAKSTSQLQWLKVSGYAESPDVMLIATDGDAIKAAKFLRSPVYRASPLMLEKFHIERTPSYVRQVGNQLEITEVGIEDIERVIAVSRVQKDTKKESKNGK